MSSSVERLDRYANWKGSRVALHKDGSVCDRAVVIVAGGRRLFRDRDDGGGFEARGDNSLSQRGVEDVCEDICELLGTVSQDTTRNVVRTLGFPWVRLSEGTHTLMPHLVGFRGRY